MSLLRSNMMPIYPNEVQISKSVNWKYDEDPYGQSSKGILLAQEAYSRRDLRFIERDTKSSKSIINKARAMYQYANELTFDRNKSGEQTIYQNWPLEQDKYIEQDCESENSEDNEVQIDFPCCDDIMAIIDTEKQEGKMYFVVKARLQKDSDFSIVIQRIKGGGHDVQVIELLEKKDSYYLYKISMTSQIKVFKIILLMNGQKVLQSKPYNFSIDRIEYDAGLSYDFIENKKLRMSNFEGLLIASSFNLVDQIDFFEKSIAKFQDKAKPYLNEKIEIDAIFQKFIFSQRNPEKFLLQLQAILKSPENDDQKMYFYNNYLIKKMANYFIKFMVNYELKVDEQKKITLNKAQKLIECFLEIISIENISKTQLDLINEEDKIEAEKKVPLYLEFLIQYKKFEMVGKYIDVQIVNKLNILHRHKGLGSFLDLIQQSQTVIDETYVDLITILIYYYMSFTELGSKQLISAINQIFNGKQYQWNSEDEEGRQNIITGFQIQIAQRISIPLKNYELFETFYKTVSSNKKHAYLENLFANEKLNKTIDQYIDNMAKQIADITELPLLEKGIKILVQICCSDPIKYLPRSPNKLTLATSKLLKSSSNYSKNINIKQKCQIVHNLILNPLMKNGTNEIIQTVRTICEDFAKIIKNKFLFMETNEIINNCFDPSILSNLNIQQIYTNNFLKEIYRMHFIKENASDIEKCKKDYSNWHNNFSYKPFINAFLVEAVAKLLCANKKDNRKMKQIISDLKDLIDRGTCSHYEKQTLKTIVELDNFELDENIFVDVLAKNRDKLFILKKIKDQGEDQKFTLESLISEFRRKAQNQELPAKTYFDINAANRLERNMIENIFAPEGIIDLIDEKVHNLNECFQKLTKFRNFVECLNNKYKLTDYETTLNKLKEIEEKTRQKTLSDMKYILVYLNKVDENILRSYSFKCFFSGQIAQNITLDQAIEKCKHLQKRMIENRDRVLRQYQRNQLTYESINFFKEELSMQKQLFDLFMINVNQNQENAADASIIKQLLKIFSLLKKIPVITNYIKGLQFYLQIDESGKFKELSNSLKNFLAYLNQISSQISTTNISKLYHEYEKANNLIGCFRFSKSSPQCLKMEDARSIELLRFFYQMSLISQADLNTLLTIKQQLTNMKQKCDEDESEYKVHYEDLEKAEVMIKYIQKIYNLQKMDIKSLISSTVKLMGEHPRLKSSYTVFQQLKQLIFEYKHVNQGDKKMVQKIKQILQKCTVDLRFNDKNTLSIKLLLENRDSKNKMKSENSKNSEQNANLITEDDIRKYKNETVMYIIQTNQKKKTQEEMEKTKHYQSFFELLKCIDQIKLIWKQLQQWGYIIFRTNESGDAQASLLAVKTELGQSEQDRQLKVQNNDHKKLVEYIKQKRDICQEWIKEIKQLHSISPKATLLQGESLKNFYQILTGFSVQKISNFLNICEPQTLKQYVKKKNYKFKKHPRTAIHLIKDFFNHLVSVVKEEEPSVMDYSQCYIKKTIFNEKQNDFIKGIVELDPVRIKNIDMTKILICVDGTTSLDIKSFIETALRDEKNQYVIMRPQKLSNQDQEYIIKQIKEHQKLNKKLTLKLCLVTNSSIQGLYQYLVNTLPKRVNALDVGTRQKAYEQFINKRTQNLKIVKSSCPGFGKTSWITKDSQKNNRKCFFLPISGAPQSQSIYERFQKITRQIYLRKQNEGGKLSSLVIQIHNVDPGNFEIVNTFLQQVITGRCVRYNGKFPKLINDTKVYIEIENIQSVNKYDPLSTFTFLKQIVSKKGNALIQNITSRPPIDFSKFDKKQMEYIIDHLQYLDKNMLDTNLAQQNKNIKRFDEFEPKGMDNAKEARANQLMQIYFYDKLKEATFYQFQYFCRLLFDACKAFSSSYGLTFTFLQKQYDAKYIKLFGFAQMRSEFFKVILKNCIDFIRREVDYEEFNFQQRTQIQQRLSSIPFLIIPNKDGESFSFIYKNHQSVPAPIRNFYISQNTQLVNRIGNGSQQVLIKLFEEHSIKKLQSTNPKKFDQKISQILQNISGNRNYSIQKDPNYIVNIDNFFKMCLITLRERQNIPIIIMGEAGTGKTALLKHVSEKLYENQFMTLNVNAGTKVEDLRTFLRKIREKHTQLKASLKNKKIWIFFDEFNTLKQVGYIKEIMIDKRFEGKQLDFLQDVVIMAACNPFRKLNTQNRNLAEMSMLQNQNEQQNEKKEQALAFHVLPPPHSMIECMWNYGALSPYEYERYISKMISNVDYKTNDATKLLLLIHKYLQEKYDSSFVSLRDIERFRTIYQFFNTKLALNCHQKTKTYAGYNNREERALILSFIFCYTLRIESDDIKNHIYSLIQQGLKLNGGHIQMVKQTQQTDFFNRLKIDYSSIAANSAIKENCYAFFVAVYNKLPMIIVGPPGCSKSLAIRILTQNMKGMHSEDKYLTEFQAMRAINFQGSELCTSTQVEALFSKAILSNKKSQNNIESSLIVIVFDEIGLADKSKDNPLKVLHPYLQVSKDLNLSNHQLTSKNYSFLGISNSNLDISKMSRMLVLRRPQPSTQQLKQTAVGIGRSFEYGKNDKISMMIEKISQAFFSFVDEWHQQKKFRNFYSLRDFYSLIKYFLATCQQRQININDDKQLNNLFEEAVFKNLNGMNGSIELFIKEYRAKTGQVESQISLQSKFNVVQNILKSLEKQNVRFPLVIAEDNQSLSYLINMLTNKFKKRTTYFEKSPFSNDHDNNQHVLHTTASIIKTLGKGDKLILNNIEPTIQTSLYDMLNKFYIVRGDENYCRISEVQSGLTKKTLVNKEFNCICFLLEENLKDVEAPFLSRFEKYNFSLKKMSNAKQIQKIVQQAEQFKKSVMEICKSKNLSHYKIENFFQNCERDVLRTLILRIYNEVSAGPNMKMESIIQQRQQEKPGDIERLILNEVIYDMIMNSTQDFIMIYQYILSKEPQMQIYSQSISRAVEKKKTFFIDGTNNVILFTTDKNVVFNGCNEPKAIKTLQLEMVKTQSSFDQSLQQYLNSLEYNYLFVELKAIQLSSIPYLISQIQKIKQQEAVSKGKSFDNKKIFILHELDRKGQNIKKDKDVKLGSKHNGISFLCEYPQIFFEGKFQLGMIKYDKKEFFTNVIDLTHILEHIQEFFLIQLKCKDDDNKSQLLKSFKTLYSELAKDKNGLLHSHIEQFIEKTEGTNVTINENLVLEVLQNAEFLKNCKNFKQALTKQLSNKSFYAVVAFLLKYLFENEAFLTYSKNQLYTFNAFEHFNLVPSRKKFIENTKTSAVYVSNLKLITTKKLDFLKNEYKKLKQIRRLPSMQRKFTAEIQCGRLIHFSKGQNEIILNKEVGSLSDLAHKITAKSTNLQKQLRLFKQQLYKKSTFVIKNDTEAQNSEQNLYNSINKDENMKELFVYELLMDLVEKKGINVKHIEMYMRILKLFINFDSTNNKKTFDVEYHIFALLIYEQVLTFVFKLFSVFFDNDVLITPMDTFHEAFRIRQIKDITQENCSRFVNNLIKNYLDPIFMDQKTISYFKGPKIYYEIFTNCMLQIENLQKILKKKQSFSSNLVSLRDIARFCSDFNEEHKFELLQQYVRKMNQKKNQKNTYSVTFNFVQSLIKNELSESEKEIIMKFQANKIFLQWFKDRPDDENCLQFFIQKCESDQNFCHNSMHVINYLLNQKEYDYENIEDVEMVMQQSGNELSAIAKYSKSKGFQNNLCILMINIFIQKLQRSNTGKSHRQILQEHKNNFIVYYKKLSLNNLDVEIFQIFLFAYVKFVLISYAELFVQQNFDNQISELLNGDNYLSTNSRLFCLKILRKHFTSKQIKAKFINLTRMHWSKKVEPDFKENQQRSLIVPKDFCSAELTNIFDEIQQSDGASFALFEKMLNHAKGFENRYSIFNFFLRFYYTLSYNQKTYKAKTIEYFATVRAKFEQSLGKIETNLIERYLKNEFSSHFSVKTSQTVNEQDFIALNFMNIFLASKDSISPLHSLFCKDGQIQSNIFELTNDQFAISGPQNPFINIAESIIQLTRNNNIGVYICCSDCDYIYCHQNCGWPNQQVDCPMCGQKIGCKDRGHTLSRDDKGARRVMSKVLVDKSAYYVWSMTQLTQFWEIQRKYISAEINRMKLKKETTIKLKKEVCKLTGLNIVNSGRVSSFSYKILSFFIDSISYLLVSLKVINTEQIEKLFGVKTEEQALNKFHTTIRQTISQTKTSLNLGNKFLGWMFGIQRQFMMDMNDFKRKFTEHQLSIIGQMDKLKHNLNARIQQKKIGQDYINLYVDFVRIIEQGYFVKEQCSVDNFTAMNRFTRDYSEKLFENLVKTYTGDKKFDFSIQYQSTQGKMQFPFDTVLTEDQIDKEKYNYYRIFKLPDQQIGYQQIAVKYEAIIKQKYPYLDFILKNSDQFIQMKNFYTVVSFVNDIHKQVNNRYERTKAEEPLSSFIQQLQQEQGNSLSKKLKNYKDMIQSWKKLSKFLGVLQNECKVIGKMNDDYDANTPLKAFLLDQSTKQNAYGLMIASIFHNFAKMHNESMSVLNSRKNQIKAYSSLNLFNDLLKLHPQEIQLEQIFTLDEAELKQNLESCSVSSIIYGQNFIFHNFDAYQEYFLKKLEGKCEIISNLKEFISVCYNGEAFSAQTQGSAVLAEIRQILDKKLSNQSLRKVKDFIRKSKSTQFFQKSIVQVRGDLQKIMLMLNTLKGNYSKDQSCSQIIKQASIPVNSTEIKNEQLSQIPVCQIYDLYELLEDELKHLVLKRLPEKYKAKMDNEVAQNVENFLKELPQQPNDESPALQELESAVMKFTSRTLQNGIFDAEKMLVEFVINRADFWPKDYSDDKKYVLSYDPTMCSVQISHVASLLEIIANVKKNIMKDN